MVKSYKKTISEFEKRKSKARKLKDVSEWYSDKEAVKKELKKNKNKIVYETFTKSYSPVELTLTVIHPGSVGKEFYMTKGHVHKKKVPEFYVLLEGNGALYLQKGIKKKTVKMKKGEITLIPEGYAHRLVNVGKTKLKVLTIYHEDSKPDYNVKFKKRFLK